MESTLKKINSNKYILTVEVGKEELKKYIEKAENDIAKDIQVDGFRKGRVPKDIVKKQIGDQQILEKAMDTALNGSLSKVLSEQELEVINVSDLDIKENSADKLVYSVNLMTFPEIELADLSKIKINKKQISVDDKDVEETLGYLRESRAKFIDKNGNVEKGDRIEIDFEVTSDGLPVEGGVSKNHPLIVGDNKFIPGFEEQLVGMGKEEEKEFSIDAPKDYSHKSLAGKKLDFKVKVSLIQKVEKPEIDDAFAMELGRFSSLEELKENLRQGILEDKKVKESQRLRLEMIGKIAEVSKIDIPDDMIKERLDAMIANFDNDLHSKGLELSFYLAHLKKTEDDLRKDWEEDARKQVSYALVLRKIAKDKKISVSREEVEEESNKMIQSMMVRGEASPESIDVAKVKEAVEGDMINERVFKFLEEHCIA